MTRSRPIEDDIWPAPEPPPAPAPRLTRRQLLRAGLAGFALGATLSGGCVAAWLWPEDAAPAPSPDATTENRDPLLAWALKTTQASPAQWLRKSPVFFQALNKHPEHPMLWRALADLAEHVAERGEATDRDHVRVANSMHSMLRRLTPPAELRTTLESLDRRLEALRTR